MIKRYNRLNWWIINHLRALREGFSELVLAPLQSLMTIAVIGVAVTLPVGFYMLLQNFQSFTQSFQGHPTITLYLKKNTTEPQIQALKNQLLERSDIQNVKYISSDEGLNEFKKDSQFGDILNALPDNPLPPVLVITPTAAALSPNSLEQLTQAMKALPSIELTTLDMTWVKRLFYLLTIGKRITDTLAVLLGMGVMLIIGNTIRLTTQTHRQEINMLKLVGATNAFIRRPWLYRGFLYGFFGGCLAWVLVSLLLWSLSIPAASLAASYGNHFSMTDLSGKTGLMVILAASLLGLLGAWISVRRHLIANVSL